MLNMLTTNCEPILSEIVQSIDHFNSYNKMEKAIEKAGINIEDVTILRDCNFPKPPVNINHPHSNYHKLKNTYIAQVKLHEVKQRVSNLAIDEGVPLEWGNKKSAP